MRLLSVFMVSSLYYNKSLIVFALQRWMFCVALLLERDDLGSNIMKLWKIYTLLSGIIMICAEKDTLETKRQLQFLMALWCTTVRNGLNDGKRKGCYAQSNLMKCKALYEFMSLDYPFNQKIFKHHEVLPVAKSFSRQSISVICFGFVQPPYSYLGLWVVSVR